MVPGRHDSEATFQGQSVCVVALAGSVATGVCFPAVENNPRTRPDSQSHNCRARPLPQAAVGHLDALCAHCCQVLLYIVYTVDFCVHSSNDS